MSIRTNRHDIDADIGLPGVAVDVGKPGVAVVAWQTQGRAYKTVRFARGAFGEIRRLTRALGNVGYTLGSDTPAVAASRDGSAVFPLGTGSRRVPGELFSVTQSPKGELSPQTVIDPISPACDAALSGNRRGDVVFAWLAPPEFEHAVKVAYHRRGARAWSPPFDVSEGRATARCYGTAAAIAGDGSAIVAWTAGHGATSNRESILLRRTTSPG